MNAPKTVLWDDVPEDVKARVTARTDVKEGGTAIVDCPAGRWYFRRVPYGWRCLSHDPSTVLPEAIAPDLTDAQRELANAQVARVEEAMHKALAARAPKEAAKPRHLAEEAFPERLKKHLERTRELIATLPPAPLGGLPIEPEDLEYLREQKAKREAAEAAARGELQPGTLISLRMAHGSPTGAATDYSYNGKVYLATVVECSGPWTEREGQTFQKGWPYAVVLRIERRIR